MIGDMPWYVWMYGGALAFTGAALIYGLVILVISLFSVFWEWVWGQSDHDD